MKNLHYSIRQLRHAPEMTFVAIVTLALGIGANTAMFTVAESVLLRPLPYADPAQLVAVTNANPDTGGAVSWLDCLDIQTHSHTLSNVAAFSTDVGVLQINGTSQSLVTSVVTPNLMPMLGVHPLTGHLFTPEDAAESVLLSEGLWRQSLAADPAVVGRRLRINGHTRTVIGVMPGSFRFPEAAGKEIEKGLWLPMQPTPEMLQDRGADFFSILAKRQPGSTVAQVQAELGLIARNIPGQKLAFDAQSYHEMITGPVRQVFLALVAALALVLLIVCANVANLLIARGLGRQHEFAVRAALGSGRLRLIGQMVAEAGLLSFLGSVLGVALAYAIIGAVHNLPPGLIPRSESIEVRWTVLLFLAALAAVTTIVSALVPALLTSNVNVQTVLRTGARSLGRRTLSTTACIWFAGGEVALSLLLLVAAGLLFRTLWGLEHARLGFEAASVTSFVAMPADAVGFGNSSSGSSQTSVAATTYYPLLESLRHAPGVQAAALVTSPPFSGFVLQTNFRVIGWPRQTKSTFPARLVAVSGSYDQVMTTPILRGRAITELDSGNSQFVAVINQALAQKFFAGKDPIGQQLDLGGDATGMLKPYTIVGILADQVDTNASTPAEPQLMLSYRQIPPVSLYYSALLKTAVHFTVKTHGSIAAAPVVRAIFHAQAPDLALDNFQTMQEAIDKSNLASRLGLYITGAFAALAVIIVITGLYGVLSQVASLRCREFGLRMALGATRESILRLVLLWGSRIVAAGLVLGIFASLSMGRLINSFLYGVKPLDAATYACAIVALLLIGIGAALVPAWRAASLQPLEALRDD